MTPDPPSHYGTISRALHWGMAIAIACMYLLALAWRVSGHTETLIPVHKALGTLLLMLVFARILWAIAAEQRPRATSLAARLGRISEADADRAAALFAAFGLPTTVPADISSDAIRDKMQLDKKTRGGQLRLVLPQRFCDSGIDRDISEVDIAAAIAACRE